MWIEEIAKKNGQIRFRYYERYKCPFTNKLKRVSVTYNTNSKHAQKQAFLELQDKIREITSVDNYADKSLSDLFTEYCEYKKSFRKITTQKNYERLQKAIIKVFPENILLSKLTIPTVQKSMDNFQLKYSNNYSKNAFSFIRQVLKYAKRMGYISSLSIIENVELHKVQKTVDEVKKEKAKFLTKEELSDLLSRLNKLHPHVAMICEFQALTGLRFGEMVALRVQDYDKKNNVIDVNATLATIRSARLPSMRIPPKNVYSIRKVLLDPRAAQIISYFMTVNSARRLWKPGFEKTDYIFVTDGGLPFDLHYVNKLIKKLNFHKPVSTHTFRHTHISLLAAANVPLKAIMERVGHNEPRTTLAIYTHVTEEMEKEVNKAITDMGKALLK